MKKENTRDKEEENNNGNVHVESINKVSRTYNTRQRKRQKKEKRKVKNFKDKITSVRVTKKRSRHKPDDYSVVSVKRKDNVTKTRDHKKK